MNTPSSPKGHHALVIGGSLAGLLAARVLRDHFERVTVVERDRLPEAPAPRAGVPQARHQHALLVRGRLILERLFPGLQEELVRAGAPLVDMAADMAWLTPAGWGIRFSSSLVMLACSRDLLEWSVRRRLGAQPGLRFLEQGDVDGLAVSPDGGAVAAAFVRSRREPMAPGRIDADLVIDASGRGSRAPHWLEALGYDRPEETTVNAFLGYASRIYQRPASLPVDWKAAYIQPAPPEFTRGGVAFPLEGDRWMVTLAGLGGDYPPTDEAGFLAFARSLRSPALYESIKDAEPVSPIASCRATQNRRRHYERLRRFPERFVVLGDAACAFNPVYAQGMTMAAVGAELLDRCLRERPDLSGLPSRFHRKLARANRAAWMLATSEDLRVRGTVGGRLDVPTRLMHGYLDQIVALTTRDPGVRVRLLEVFHMLRSPAALFAPHVLARVIGQAVGGATSASASVAGVAEAA